MTTQPSHAVGVDLGTTYTCAAVADRGGVRVVQLTGTSQTVPSIVSITDDGVIAGEAAERRLVSHPSDTAREFKRRFGDPSPMVLAGATYTTEQITSFLLREVLDRVEQAEGSAPTVVGLSHPASWGPFRLDLLRSVATEAGVTQVELIPEPVAAAYANRDRVEEGSLIAVYDLGGGTFDAAVVKCDSDWSVVGVPEGVERLGGIDFDQAIMAHVDTVLDGQVFMLDTSDPDARSALMQLRAECQKAKEHLSQDTDVEIPVSLPNLRTSVRLTRGEFESMVRPRLSDSLSVLDRVVTSAGVTWDDISNVLLVGGSSNIPAVGQLVAEHTGRPLMSATNPHLAIAIGTAAISRQRSILAPVTDALAAPVAAAPTPASAPVTPAKKHFPIGAAIGGLVAAAVIAVGAVVVLGGGDDDATPGPSTTEPGNAQDVTATQPQTTQPEPDDSATTETPTTEPAAGGTALEPSNITICGDGAGVTDISAATDGILVATGGSVILVEASAVSSCSIDLSTAGPARAMETVTDARWISSNEQGATATSESSGQIINRETGNSIECVGLTGPTAMTGFDRTFVIDGPGVVALVATNEGCTPETILTPDVFTARSIASDDRTLVVTGTEAVTGERQIRLFTRGEQVIGGSSTAIGSADAVSKCGTTWCVVDLENQRLVIVDGAGTAQTERQLGSGLAAEVTGVNGITGLGQDVLAVLQLADGSTPMVRITR